MEIFMRTADGVQVVQGAGAASIDTHERLRRTFKTAIDVGRSRIVVDLSRATSIDSLTLGELVAGLKRAREAGGELALVVTPGGEVHGVIEITRLDRVFRLFGSEDEAVAATAQSERP